MLNMLVVVVILLAWVLPPLLFRPESRKNLMTLLHTLTSRDLLEVPQSTTAGTTPPLVNRSLGVVGERSFSEERRRFLGNAIVGQALVMHTAGVLFIISAIVSLGNLLVKSRVAWVLRMSFGEAWFKGGSLAWIIALDVAALLLGCTMIARGFSLNQVGLRHLSEVLISPQELQGKAFTLYLRSFEDDLLLARPQRLPFLDTLVRPFTIGRTEEQQLARALRPLGLLVAAGRPGEIAPHIGAQRVYLPIEDWQEQVHDLIQQARVVVLALGAGAGTMWELCEAVRILPPERLLLVVPMQGEEYEQFRRVAAPKLSACAEGKAGSQPRLPVSTGDRKISSTIQGLISFSADWTPTFRRLGSDPLYPNSASCWSVYCALAQEIVAFFAQLRAYERRTVR